MLSNQKTITFIGIMALSFWLVFLFVDGSFSSPSSLPSPLLPSAVSDMQTTPLVSPDITGDETALPLPTDMDEVNVQHGSAFLVTSQTGQAQAINLATASEFTTKQANLTDIALLESLYVKNPHLGGGQADSQILVTLIQRLVADYQFADANAYLVKLMQISQYEKLLDANTILYILLHRNDISYKNPQSINELLPLIAQFRQEGLLTKDDENFYNGLVAIRFKKYADATKSFSSIQTTTYQPLIQSYQKALTDFSGSKNMPAYYQDALVALSMLKNGYFSIAKNLALGAVMQDENYILPYQILAYANFLSNNWDVASEYFLKLADSDANNKGNYLFLVGISYYRMGEYDQAVLYLNQVSDLSLLTDVYRYELLSFLAGNDMDNALRIRQKILGQDDLNLSDFTNFFDTFYYMPYANGQPFTLYNENVSLASMYQDSCARLFSGGADVCTYGQIGQDLTNLNWTGLAEKLLYLSSTYHQGYLFHVLGDYYFQHNEYDLAKDAYLQALNFSTQTNEQIILKNQIEKVVSGE